MFAESPNRLLSSRFLAVWLGETGSSAGSALASFVVPVLLADTLQLTPFEIGAVMAVGSAAPLLLSLSSGAIADRFERRTLLTWSSALRAVLVALIPLLLVFGMLSGWVLAIILFMVNALTLLFDAAMTAVIPQMVSRRNLIRANSLMELSVNTSGTIAPTVGGAIMTWLGAPAAFIINAVTYALSAVTSRSVPATDQGERTSDELPQSHFRDIRDGLRAVWRHSVMRPVLVTAASFNFFHAWLFAVFTVFALRVLHFSPFLLGVVLTVSAVFGILGAALAPRLIAWQGPGRAVIVAFVLIGMSAASLPFLGSMSSLQAAVTTTIVFGLWDLAVTVAVIVGNSARQTLLPDEFRSRAAGTERFATWGLDPLGALAGGAVASTVIGLTGSVTIAALGMLVPAAVAACSSGLWQLRELPEEDEDEATMSSS